MDTQTEEKRKPLHRLPIVDMDLAYSPPEWVTFGACAQPDFIAINGYNFMFPEEGRHGPVSTIMQEKVCAGCPVQKLCEDYGKDEPWGVWGGRSRKTRLAEGDARGRPWDPETGQVMVNQVW